MNIIYMGLFDYYNYAMTNARINYARMRKLIMRINTDLPPGEGLGFLGPPS